MRNLKKKFYFSLLALSVFTLPAFAVNDPAQTTTTNPKAADTRTVDPKDKSNVNKDNQHEQTPHQSQHIARGGGGHAGGAGGGHAGSVGGYHGGDHFEGTHGNYNRGYDHGDNRGYRNAYNRGVGVGVGVGEVGVGVGAYPYYNTNQGYYNNPDNGEYPNSNYYYYNGQ